jgi:hypothetical protein
LSSFPFSLPYSLDFAQLPSEFFSDKTSQFNICPSSMPASFMTPKQCKEKLYTLPDKEMYLSTYKSWYENNCIKEAIASLGY